MKVHSKTIDGGVVKSTLIRRVRRVMNMPRLNSQPSRPVLSNSGDVSFLQSIRLCGFQGSTQSVASASCDVEHKNITTTIAIVSTATTCIVLYIFRYSGTMSFKTAKITKNMENRHFSRRFAKTEPCPHLAFSGFELSNLEKNGKIKKIIERGLIPRPSIR